MAKRQRVIEKAVYAIFFRSTGLVKAIKVKGQKTVAVNWYQFWYHFWNITICVPEILQQVNVRRLHHDNESSHTTGLAVEFLEQKQIKVMEYLPILLFVIFDYF